MLNKDFKIDKYIFSLNLPRHWDQNVDDSLVVLMNVLFGFHWRFSVHQVIQYFLVLVDLMVHDDPFIKIKIQLMNIQMKIIDLT
jgi:hypothetical protein